MSLTIAIVKETEKGENRVAATPETVKKYRSMGADVSVEKGAGIPSSIPDDMYEDAGAELTDSRNSVLEAADIVLCVQALPEKDLHCLKEGALLVGTLNPYARPDVITTCAEKNTIAMAMELMPRITRAQAMDVLSSQSNLAGYRAVLDACHEFNRAFPMMMTAAGTVPPAKVFVMGAGVAGLQAIATARRLGAVVSATDVRPAAKEQVESLGASFIAVEDEEFKQAEAEGGYAQEMSADYKQKQADLVAKTLAKQDVVITTALIPGKPAPELISRDMVKSMKPGAVIVDLAVEQGGNCALSEAGKITTKHGVTIVGHKNMPARLAADASALYAKNLLNLITLLVDQDSGALAINWEDDIVTGITLTRDGQVVHPRFVEAAGETQTQEPGAVPGRDQDKKKQDDKDQDATGNSEPPETTQS